MLYCKAGTNARQFDVFLRVLECLFYHIHLAHAPSGKQYMQSIISTVDAALNRKNQRASKNKVREGESDGLRMGGQRTAKVDSFCKFYGT